IVRVISDHLRWKRPSSDAAWSYNVVQRLTYLAVVFVLFPGIVWTGLGMSFGITSVLPILATAIGGHQSARTLHFVFVVLLLLFAIVHVTMLMLAGFWRNVRAMITGYLPHGNENGNSMNELLVRRRFITAGLATAAGASGLGAAVYFAD